MTPPADEKTIAPLVLERPLVLVGMMGVGKTTVGRRLASTLKLPFIDSDQEIEKAAGMSVAEIFEHLGEPEFRAGERRVFARLLDGSPRVIAAGGGAFAEDETRQLIKAGALTVWLDANLETLVARTSRRQTRPLLNAGDPRQILSDLLDKRRHAYAMADIRVVSGEGNHQRVVSDIIASITNFVEAS